MNICGKLSICHSIMIVLNNSKILLTNSCKRYSLENMLFEILKVKIKRLMCTEQNINAFCHSQPWFETYL